jgi:sigma-B regulation protein RsbU (phosphoserine phosphatase)
MFPKHPEVEAHAMMKPAREVGGDFFDALPLNDHCLCVAVGDVCGKGMPAALFVVRVMTLLRICLLRESDPAAILPAVNRLLCEANEECMYVTMGVALVDFREGSLTYLNGGHNPPFFSSGGQPFALWTPAQGTLLGFDPNAQFSVTRRALTPGDTLVLWTDGVSEAENVRPEQFGLTRSAEALKPDAPIIELVEDLGHAVAQFAGDAEQSDDITVLALRYLSSRNGTMI